MRWNIALALVIATLVCVFFIVDKQPGHSQPPGQDAPDRQKQLGDLLRRFARDQIDRAEQRPLQGNDAADKKKLDDKTQQLVELFKRLAGENDYIDIAEQKPLKGKEEMELFAFENGITNGQLDQDQFLRYWARRDALSRRPPRTRRKSPSSSRPPRNGRQPSSPATTSTGTATGTPTRFR